MQAKETSHPSHWILDHKDTALHKSLNLPAYLLQSHLQ